MTTRDSYDAYLIQVARECRNCPECSEVPCPACCAGGICDAWCRCDEIEREYDDEDDA